MQRLWIAFLLVVGLAVGEFWVGQWSHSLALQAESGHMVADSLAIALALLAAWVARRPASSQATFGFRRVEILAALANGVGLLVVAAMIAGEALEQLQTPPEAILSQPVLITAAIGLGLNSLNAVLLHEHSHDDLNLRAAFLHMVADACSAVGVLFAAIAVWAWGWLWMDGVVSFLVAGLIAVGAVPLIRQSLNILLERAPAHLDSEEIRARLAQVEGVQQVKSLRLWTVAPGQVTLMAWVEADGKWSLMRDRLLQKLQTALREDFGIQDAVVQITAAPPVAALTLPQNQILELIQAASDPTSNQASN